MTQKIEQLVEALQQILSPRELKELAWAIDVAAKDNKQEQQGLI